MAREDTLWANDTWNFYTQPSFGSATSHALSIGELSVSVRDGKDFRFYELSGGGSGYIALLAPVLTNATRVYVFPSAIPSPGNSFVVDSVAGSQITMGFANPGVASPATFISASNTRVVLSSELPAIISATMSDVNGSFDLTLPTCVGNSGKTIEVVVSNNSATHVVRLVPDGTETMGLHATSSPLVIIGSSVKFVSDGSNWNHISSHGRIAKYFDQKANAVGGGLCAGAIETRELNTQEGDASVGTLSNDAVIIGAGRYKATFKVPANRTNSFKTWLRDATNGGELGSAYTLPADSAANENWYAHGVSLFSATGTIHVEVMMNSQTVNTNCLGIPAGSTTPLRPEIYTTLIIEKLGE